MNIAQFNIDSEWDSGLTATISFENTGEAVLDGWQFELVADFEITQVWNAELISREGDRYLFRHRSYNQVVEPGRDRSFGFLAAKSPGDASRPSELRLNSQLLGGTGSGGSFPEPPAPEPPAIPEPPITPEPAIAPEPAVTPELPAAPGPSQPSETDGRFSIVNDWGSGFTGNLTFENDSAQSLDEWTFKFTADFPIRELWGGELVGRQGNVYEVQAADWNRSLAAGQSVTLGFNVDVASQSITPPNGYSLSAIVQPSVPSPSPEPTPPPTPNLTPGPTPAPIPESPDDSSADNSQQGTFNYGEALQKSLLFYEAQRAGDLPSDRQFDWRGDSTLNDGADVGMDLSGGYFDAGDHVKFVFPMASSMTMLSWGLVEYRDAYASSGQLDGALHAIKWGTDFLLAGHQTANGKTQSLVAQVGDGNADHSYWGAPEDMTMARPTALLNAQRPGSDLAAEVSAALASASVAFRPYDAAYADKLLTNAVQIYDFADQHRGKYSDSLPGVSAFYNSWSGYEDELVWGAAWLHEALEAQGVEDTTYLNRARQAYQGVNSGWTQSWDDKSHGAAILLAQETGEARYRDDVESWLNRWQPGGVVAYTEGGLAWLDQWGSLRYSANTAFLAGVYGDTVNDPGQKYSNFAESQVDYILGDNPAGFSYMVGFGDSYAQQPHHRAASGISGYGAGFDDANRANDNVLYGALVGGPSSADDFAYRDRRNDYIANEVALDYNAGLTGALVRQYGELGGEPLSDAELNALSGVTVRA